MPASFDMTLPEIEALLHKWPPFTEGVDVGLSENASTITARNDAMGIFNSIIEIQPTLVATSGSVSEEEFALETVEHLINRLPKTFNIINFLKKFDLSNTLNTVLYHECLHYNDLLEFIQSSLEELRRGLKGLIVMDERLDLLNRRILANRVPELWLTHSFPTILTLRGFILTYRCVPNFLMNG